MTHSYPPRHPQAARPAPPVGRVVERVQMMPPAESGSMTALRAMAYLLTSLASVLFIVLVVYGYMQYQQTRAELEGLFDGGGVPSLQLPAPPPPPPAPPG